MNEIWVTNIEWKNLLLGLQEKLDVTQLQLLKLVGIKENPNVSFWISGRYVLPKQHQTKFLEFISDQKLNLLELIKFGSNIRKGVKVDEKWLFNFKQLQASKTVFIENEDDIYINPLSLFPETFKSHIIKFGEFDDKIIVFYEEKRSSRPYALTLPKCFEINEDLLLWLGIYLGEGSKNRKAKITNSEPTIINESIKFFNYFGNPTSRLTAWLQLHERSEKSPEDAKKFWIENTSLKEENIIKVRMKKSTGKAKVKQYGVLHLESPFILCQLIVEKLLELIPGILNNSNREQKIAFLQGCFAAEGSVELAKTGSLRDLTFTSTKREERSLVRKLLFDLKIETHENEKWYSVKIHGYNNLKKLTEIDIFKFHPIRREKMLRGFEILKTSHIPTLNKNKIVNILKNEPSTVNELANKCGLYYGNTEKHLLELYKLKKVRKIEGSGSIPNKWFI